jgi:ABC-2 type transport system permease protein
MRSVLAKSWYDHRHGMIGWIIGVLSLVGIAIAFWPTIQDNTALLEAFEQMPEGLKIFLGEDDLTSPTGYLDTRLFLYTIPLLFLIYAIGKGADAIAGEEKRHTLDLLMAHPIERARVLLEKYAATALSLLLLTAVLLITCVVGAELVDMNISAINLAAASVGSLMLGLHFGALAILIGGATGKKSVASGVTSAVATAAYFINSLAPQVDVLDRIKNVSAFYYASGYSPLKTGFSFGHLSVLAVTTVLFLWAAVWFFDRRDVAV